MKKSHINDGIEKAEEQLSSSQILDLLYSQDISKEKKERLKALLKQTQLKKAEDKKIDGAQYSKTTLKKCKRCNKTFKNLFLICPQCGETLCDYVPPIKNSPLPAHIEPPTPNPTEPVRCPRCGSTQITAVQRKWGIVMGFMTNKVDRFCLNCKHKW